MLLSATMLLGFGWLAFPSNVQMIWAMFAQAILFSLAFSLIVVDLMRLWKTQGFMPHWYVLVFVPIWVAIALVNVQKVYDCMPVAGQ